MGGATDRAGKFWDGIAKRYAKQPIPDEAVYEKKLSITRKYLNPSMSVLEFGCGTGGTAISHAPFVRHIRGVDISKKMLAIAEERKLESGAENVDFVQSAIDAYPAAPESVDAVLALSVLHLVEDRADALQRIHDFIKPGGYFITSTTCLKKFNFLLRAILPVGRMLGFFPLVKIFSEEEFKVSVEQAGFEIEHYWQPAPKKAVFIVAKKPEFPSE